jgi:replicative DNA helicase
VGVFSLEMTSGVARVAHVVFAGAGELAEHSGGIFVERDFPEIHERGREAGGGAARSSTTRAGLSFLQLRAKARRMWQQYGIKLFVVDYLQLLHSTARRAENRQQEIADISNGVKALAKELDVPSLSFRSSIVSWRKTRTESLACRTCVSPGAIRTGRRPDWSALQAERR